MGCGRVGSALAVTLDSAGHSVAVVNQDQSSFAKLPAGFGGQTVKGIGFDRDTLRAALPGLRFVHLAITEAESLRRVAQRPGHFYPPSLVASQFEALQDPAGEPGVLSLDATASLDALAVQAQDWLNSTMRN